MNLKKIFTKRNIFYIIALFIVVGIFCVYQACTLKFAHKSFENYYNFRGCVELLEKTDTYAVCRVKSGETIKIVKVQNKWFLDGDLGW